MIETILPTIMITMPIKINYAYRYVYIHIYEIDPGVASVCCHSFVSCARTLSSRDTTDMYGNLLVLSMQYRAAPKISAFPHFETVDWTNRHREGI